MEITKKECILSCAAKIFSRFGLKKTSVNEIAESAGVAKGTIYLACQSKEDLFYQVLHRELRDWLADTAKVIDPRQTADQLLVPVLVTGFERFDAHPLVRDLFGGKLHPAMPGWENQLDELYELGRSNLVEVLKMGIRQKIFPERLDTDSAARSLQDMQIAAVLHAQKAPHTSGADDALKRFTASVNLMLNGLRTA